MVLLLDRFLLYISQQKKYTYSICLHVLSAWSCFDVHHPILVLECHSGQNIIESQLLHLQSAFSYPLPGTHVKS